MNNDRDRISSIILLLICISMLMISLNSTIVCVALPTIASSFHIYADESSWVVLSYLLVLSSTLIIFGRLADGSAPKTLFIAGIAIFGLCALCAGLFSRFEWIIAARLGQGIGAAMMVSVGGILIKKVLPAESAGKNLGLMTTAVAVGYVIGPPLGGFLCEYLSWNWVFLINVPMALICCIAGIVVIPGIPQEPGSSPRFDIPGAILFFAAISSSVFLLSYADNLFSTPWLFSGLIFFALICWGFFVFHERRVSYPLLDLSLFAFSGFTLAIIICLFNAQMDAGSVYLYPFYLERGLHLSALNSGLTLLIFAIGMGIVGFLYGKLPSTWSPRQISIWASALLTISFVLALITISLPVMILLGIAIFIGGAGIGLLTTANNHIIMNQTPKGHEGVIWGTIMTTSALGSVTGIAVFSLLFSIFVGDTQDIVRESSQQLVFNTSGFGMLFLYGIGISVLLILGNYALPRGQSPIPAHPEEEEHS